MRRPKRRSGFACMSSHLHESAGAAEECDQRRWDTRIAEYGIRTAPPRPPEPEPFEQIEAFPEIVARRKAGK